MKSNITLTFVASLIIMGCNENTPKENDNIKCHDSICTHQNSNEELSSKTELKTNNNDSIVIMPAHICDKDGYVNLRESSAPNSNIIGTVPNAEDVSIIDMTKKEIESCKMLKVKTKDGQIGYIHYSRLQICPEFDGDIKKINMKITISSNKKTRDSLIDAILLNDERAYKEFYRIDNLLDNKKLLSADEYDYLLSFIEKNYYADLGEGFAMCTFEHFRKNKEANEQILKQYKSNQDKYLLILANSMSLYLDPYTYEKFIEEFPMFANNDTVRKRFLEFDHEYNIKDSDY